MPTHGSSMATGGILADSDDDDEVTRLMAPAAPPPPPPPKEVATKPPPNKPKAAQATKPSKGFRNFYDDPLLEHGDGGACYDRLKNYVSTRVPKYTPSQLDVVTNLLFACMITDTEHYTTLETLRDYVKETSRTKVRNFISTQVLMHPRPVSEEDQAFATKCYEAIQSFLDTMHWETQWAPCMVADKMLGAR